VLNRTLVEQMGSWQRCTKLTALYIKSLTCTVQFHSFDQRTSKSFVTWPLFIMCISSGYSFLILAKTNGANDAGVSSEKIDEHFCLTMPKSQTMNTSVYML
jgi:hypothetical protein